MADREFSMKLSPLWKPMLVRVDDHGVTTIFRKRTKRVAFSDVSRVFVFELGSHGIWGGHFSFFDRGDHPALDFGTAGFGTFGRWREDLRNYDRAAAAVLSALAKARPDVRVFLGAGRRSNLRSMAFVLIIGIGAWLFQSLTDQRIELAEYAALAMIVGVVSYVSYTRYDVFREPQSITADEAAKKFREMAVD